LKVKTSNPSAIPVVPLEHMMACTRLVRKLSK
jgi:hypothetical protein